MGIGSSKKTQIQKLNDKLNFKFKHLFYTMFLCIGVLIFINLTSSITYRVLGTNIYLTVHLLLEFTSSLIAFAAFTALYYTFDLFKNLRSIIIANVLFVVAFIDILHLMAYDGMPEFLTGNTPQKATAYWIIGRLLMSIGILIFAKFSQGRKTKLRKEFLLIISIIILSSIFYMVTYKIHWIPLLFVEGQGLTQLKVILEYVIIAIHIISILILFKEYRESKDDSVIGIMIALIFSVFSEITFTFYTSVYDTYNLIGHIFKIFAYFSIFKTLFLSTVRKPYDRLNEVQTKLKDHADNLEETVLKKTKEIREKNKNLTDINNKIVADLESAKGIQEALLPKNIQEFKGTTFYSTYLPCEKLSGDFYNYFKIDDENIGLYIIDVSGHGVSAAMVTVFASRILKGQVIDNGGDYSVIKPSEVVSNFYNIFNDSNFPDETYLVMIYGIYNTRTRKFTYATAGHNCPLFHIRGSNEVSILDNCDGFPICKLNSIITPEYKDHIIELDKGDKLIFYTDGITELKNNNQIYSLERLNELIEGHKKQNSKELMSTIIDDLWRYKDLTKVDDDITLFIMDVD